MADPSISFHVAGVLVQATPRAARSVGERIRQFAGARVHAADGLGRLVVTLESEEAGAILAQLTQLQTMDGVMSAVLVSEYSEPLAAANQEIRHDPAPQDPA